MARRSKRIEQENQELNLAPIMNMVIILIPLLLLSVVFLKVGVINITAPKTDAFAAKLSDLLLPTEDRNYTIRPSPVPEMAHTERKPQGSMEKAKARLVSSTATFDEASEAGTPAPGLQEAMIAAADEVDAIQAELDALQELREEANLRAELMLEEIDDQLKSTNYNAENRDMIDDACKLNTGVMIGPVLSEKRNQHRMRSKNEDRT